MIIEFISQISITAVLVTLYSGIAKTRFNRFINFLIFYGVAIAIFLLTFSISHIIELKTLISIIVLSSLMYFLSVDTMKRRFKAIIVFWVVLLSTELTFALILVPMLGVDLNLVTPNTFNEIRFVILSIYTNYLVIVAIIAIVVFKKLRRDIKLIIIGLMLLVFLPQVIFIMTMFAYAQDMVLGNIPTIVLVSTSVTLVANIIVYILIEKLVKIKEDENELEHLKSRSQLIYDYYQLATDNAHKISLLRHEISNQLQTVSSLFASDEAKAIALLANVNKSFGKVQRIHYCDHPVVNTVLAIKTAAAEEKSIKTDIQVGDIQNKTISDMDLCSVFGNLYDNAIEACEKLESEKRQITIRAAEKSGFLIVSFGNPFEPSLLKDSFRSTKQESGHGLGLKMLDAITKKHNGEMQVKADNGWFEATVSLETVTQD